MCKSEEFPALGSSSSQLLTKVLVVFVAENLRVVLFNTRGKADVGDHEAEPLDVKIEATRMR
jgi:hypothetical protein